ncbi:MAG: aminopeptidase P N-terminal domain-containing protein [Synergistaceae bacterium]|nr:aminopeptidase P N-terminal domain-containing protein [Synergistaceae bacterium]
MDRDFFTRNRQAFEEAMTPDSIAVFFSGSFHRDTCDQLIHPFSVDRNFFYFTGVAENDIALLIHKSRNGTAEFLFIPPVDEHYEKWQAKMLRPSEARDISGVENILYTYEFDREIGLRMYTDMSARSLYLYSAMAELNEPDTPSGAFANRFRRSYPSAAILNSLDIMIALRRSKQPEEVEMIQSAVDLAGGAMAHMASLMSPGIYEYQIKAHYQHYLNMHGSAPRFRSIVAAGKNATILHYNKGDYQTKEGDLVLVDAGATVGWYLSDLTRTFPVSGRFTDRQRAFYDIVLDAEYEAIGKMAAGVSEYEVNAVIKSHYAKALKAMGKIQDDSEVERYYYHGSGHPIGLDLHECRTSDRMLFENSVYTIEPGLYIGDEGFGIRIEDNVLVGKNGVKVLSAALPKKPDEVERMVGTMAGRTSH